MLFVPINSAYSDISIQMDNKPINPSRGNTLYVGGSGPGNYTKIQDAIDDASDGDTVFVYNDSSPYSDVDIDKSINLIGEDKESTVIRGGEITTIDVSSDWVNISGFTIQTLETGIFTHANYSTIIGNNIFDALNGIWVEKSNNNIFSNNILMNNYYNGIYLIHSSNNTISKNNFISTARCSMHIYYSNYNIISNNNISYGGNYGPGMWFEYSNCNIITGNTITSVNRSGIQISGENNKIYHNNFINNTDNAYDVGNNTWDDSKYGNYWSDYEKRYPDAKPRILKPWMWDTPYQILGDGKNNDNCPLVNQWPKSKSKHIPNNKVISKSPLLRFLERYPLLNRLLSLTMIL